MFDYQEWLDLFNKENKTNYNQDNFIDIFSELNSFMINYRNAWLSIFNIDNLDKKITIFEFKKQYYNELKELEKLGIDVEKIFSDAYYIVNKSNEGFNENLTCFDLMEKAIDCATTKIEPLTYLYKQMIESDGSLMGKFKYANQIEFDIVLYKKSIEFHKKKIAELSNEKKENEIASKIEEEKNIIEVLNHNIERLKKIKRKTLKSEKKKINGINDKYL